MHMFSQDSSIDSLVIPPKIEKHTFLAEGNSHLTSPCTHHSEAVRLAEHDHVQVSNGRAEHVVLQCHGTLVVQARQHVRAFQKGVSTGAEASAGLDVEVVTWTHEQTSKRNEHSEHTEAIQGLASNPEHAGVGHQVNKALSAPSYARVPGW